jgi:hypothetical protein
MCSGNEDCGGDSLGKCNEKDLCECSEEYYGLRCGFHLNKTCRELVIDERTEPLAFGPKKRGNEYTLIEQNGRPTEIFGHPVYASRRDTTG